MNYLYKLVTTENVDLNYKAFKKDELIDCISNLRTTYFRLKKENEENKQLKDNWNMLKEHLKNRYDNGTESISYRQVFMEIREAMQVLEIAQELEKGDSNGQ